MFFVACVVVAAVLLCLMEASVALEAVNISDTVPKIIHQTWKTHTAPEKWSVAQESWPRLHPDWEYHLWSDEDNEHFIREKYPWFLETFLSYPHPIQRADSVRYFLLYTYGGLYVDLDMEALKPFDDLIVNKTVALARSSNTGKFTNNLMISRRGEPYWEFVFNELLTRANKTGFITSEVEILETTGPRLMQMAAAAWDETGHLPEIEGIPSKLVHPCGRCEPVPCTKPGAYIRLWEGNSWHDMISSLGMFFDCHGLTFAAILAIVIITCIVAVRQFKKMIEADARHRNVPKMPKCTQLCLHYCCCVSLVDPSHQAKYSQPVQQDNFDEEDELMDL